MKIVVDDKIPYIREALAKICNNVVYLEGAAITNADILDADALIIRTRTICNEQLLKNSKVSFIATATIGYDHLDTDYLKSAHITWTNCPGCNATSVGQYIHSCLLLLEKEKGLNLSQTTIGIVGAGHVGQAVIQALRPLGVKILVNDPPLQEKLEKAGNNTNMFTPLEVLEAECNIISFHTPLTTSGKYPTFHLADTAFFSRLKKKPIIINSSRGSVVDNNALMDAIKKQQIKDVIIDTWENEPNIHQDLLQSAYIGTPHIAGYSADGKANATRMALQALCKHFHLSAQFEIHPPHPILPKDFSSWNTKEKALFLYNPYNDSEPLKKHPERFEHYRGNYPLRRELHL